MSPLSRTPNGAIRCTNTTPYGEVKHPGNCGGFLSGRWASGEGRIPGYVQTTQVPAGAVGSRRADGGGVGPSDRACGQGSGS